MVAGDGSPSAGSTGVAWKPLQGTRFDIRSRLGGHLHGDDPVLCQNSDSHDIPKRRPTALGPVANTDTKLLIYGLFQKSRVLAQDAIACNNDVGVHTKMLLNVRHRLVSPSLHRRKNCVPLKSGSNSST